MDIFRNDLRFAARQMRKHLGFTVVAVLTLGLGIGATTSFFSILNTFSFRSLPYQEAERLVVVGGTERSGRQTGVSLAEYEALAGGGGSFEGAAAYAGRAYNLGGGANPERVSGAAVTPGFFSLFGVAPEIGRGFVTTDGGAGGERVAVLSRALWERSFLSDSRVVGSSILLDGVPHTVVGVAPARFGYPDGAALWVALDRGATAAGARELGMVARLGEGVSAERADAALAALSRGLADATPGSEQGWTAGATALREVVGAKLRGAAVVLLIASLVVLLIACGNLASLQLVLVSARTHEIAVRAALGASRARIVRLLVTEGLLLALTGGIIGVLVARAALAGLVGLLGTPPGGEWMEFTLDYRVLLFALALSLLAGLGASLAAALRGARAGLRASLQEGGRGSGAGLGSKRLRRGAVLAQIAVALPLVVGASSVVLSAWRLEAMDVGFDDERLVALRVSLAGEAYDTPGERVAFVEQVLPRLAAIPGARGATAASHAPLFDRQGVPSTTFVPAGWDSVSGTPRATMRFVADGYPEMMGIRVLRGRSFSASEARNPGAGVVVVNDALGRRYWPGSDPVGKRIQVGGSDGPGWLTITGVVADVMQRGPDPNRENQLYLPYPTAGELSLLIRTGDDPAAAIRAARAVVAAVDPALPLYDARTSADMWRWFFRDRVGQGAVLAALGCTALLLALLGVYGVTAFSVAQRRREFGVRIALGGRPADLLRLVLRDGAGMVGLGTGIGLLLALAITRFLSIIFADVPAFEPLLFAGVAGLLALAVLLASFLPARDATRTDPTIALRAD